MYEAHARAAAMTSQLPDRRTEFENRRRSESTRQTSVRRAHSLVRATIRGRSIGPNEQLDEWKLMQITERQHLDAWDMIAIVTGRHVNPRFCRMVVLARGADTLTTHELYHRRSTRFTFEKAP